MPMSQETVTAAPDGDQMHLFLLLNIFKEKLLFHVADGRCSTLWNIIFAISELTTL